MTKAKVILFLSLIVAGILFVSAFTVEKAEALGPVLLDTVYCGLDEDSEPIVITCPSYCSGVSGYGCRCDIDDDGVTDLRIRCPRGGREDVPHIADM